MFRVNINPTTGTKIYLNGTLIISFVFIVECRYEIITFLE